MVIQKLNLLEWFSNNALILLLAAGTIFSFLWLMIQKELYLCWWAAAIVSVTHTILGVVCVKVFAVMETFDLNNAGNMSLFGGIFFMPLLYLLGAKLTNRNPRHVCDVFTLCMIGTVMCARINCIISGCCQGNIIPGTDHLRWPTRELEILLYLVLLFWLGRKTRQEHVSGEIYPIYMIVYGVFRFVIEWFRVADSPLGFIHLGHIWSLICLGMGVSIYFSLHNQQDGKKKKKLSR